MPHDPLLPDPLAPDRVRLIMVVRNTANPSAQDASVEGGASQNLKAGCQSLVKLPWGNSFLPPIHAFL